MPAHPLWRDAFAAAAIAAAGGAGLIVRARDGPVRRALIAEIARLVPAGMLRITADSDPAMLEEGSDVLASVAAGITVKRPSLTGRVGDRLLLVSGAERLPAVTAGLIARAIDAGDLPRLVLLDEGIDDERVPALLDERLGMRIDLDTLSMRDIEDGAEWLSDPSQTKEDGAGWPDDAALTSLCGAAATLGIELVRVPLHALAVSRAGAALGGHSRLDDDDIALAARLVLAPRARSLPTIEEPDEQSDVEPASGEAAQDRERVIDAVRAVLPPDMLEAASSPRARGAGGSAEAKRGAGARGRPGRVRRGLPTRGARLDLVATLVAAAPFQRLRDRAASAAVTVRRDDVRVRRPRPVQRALTIFAVDASGSAAVARLAEVKGAVEHLLAESYVRRDEVALIAFRGDTAETLLPPTRSLARAKRELAALPGGGTTPLAAGIVAALDQALRSRAAGRAPLILLLTDGGANVSRDGTRSRPAARADAEAVARRVASAGIAAVVVDSSPRGDGQVRALAEAAAARYVRLPGLDAARLGAVVRAA